MAARYPSGRRVSGVAGRTGRGLVILNPMEPVPSGWNARDDHPSGLANVKARLSAALAPLLRPDGMPAALGDQLESVLGGIVNVATTSGPGRLRRVRRAMADAPGRMLDWMSAQVLENPASVFDRRQVEETLDRQSRGVASAMGVLQLALAAASTATVAEGGPLVAIGIDGAVGQVAALANGVGNWHTIGSYLVHRLRAEGLVVTPKEIRRLTNAALMSKGADIDVAALASSSELRLVRRWMTRGVVDALPMGARFTSATVKVVDRIDRSDLAHLVGALRRSLDVDDQS